MTPLAWQKSSYSDEGSSCVYLAAPGNGTIRLRESDDPTVILTTTRTAIHALLSQIRSAPDHPPRPTRN